MEAFDDNIWYHILKYSQPLDIYHMSLCSRNTCHLVKLYGIHIRDLLVPVLHKRAQSTLPAEKKWLLNMFGLQNACDERCGLCYRSYRGEFCTSWKVYAHQVCIFEQVEPRCSVMMALQTTPGYQAQSQHQNLLANNRQHPLPNLWFHGYGRDQSPSTTCLRHPPLIWRDLHPLVRNTWTLRYYLDSGPAPPPMALASTTRRHTSIQRMTATLVLIGAKTPTKPKPKLKSKSKSKSKLHPQLELKNELHPRIRIRSSSKPIYSPRSRPNSISRANYRSSPTIKPQRLSFSSPSPSPQSPPTLLLLRRLFSACIGVGK